MSFMLARLAEGCIGKRDRAGFLFRVSAAGIAEVALISKKRPDWQAGKLNGVGGKIEPGETPWDAMRREFREETGAAVDTWRQFARLNFIGGTVHFFTDIADRKIESTTDEAVGWYALSELRNLPLIPNLRWLIPLAMDQDSVHVSAIEPNVMLGLRAAGELFEEGWKNLAAPIYEIGKASGFYDGEFNDAEKIALMHSELSEALEGLRGDLMDDKLPHRKMVELADTVIRIMNYATHRGLDVAGALVEKAAFNRTREKRRSGKRF